MARKHKGLPTMRTELNGLKKVFKQLPHIAGNAAVEVSQKSFAQEQFADKGKSSKWAPRKKDGKKSRNKRSALLVDSGELLKSIDYKVEGGTTILTSNAKSSKGYYYAEVHNEGGHAGRGAGFEMPKRKFMGSSPEIDKEVEKYLDEEMDKLFG